MSMADLKLPDGILVPAIYSEDRGIILSGDDKIIHAGDRAVIFSTAEQIQAVAKLV
jgi:Trk K+ transport system NAD-binding subunit